MKKKDIIIGAIVLIILGALIFALQKPNDELTVPETSTVEEEMESFFSVEIPEDVEKAQLDEVIDGYGMGIATRKYENGTFVHVVLADLPDPEEGTFYEGWLVRGEVGDTDFDFISTGKMTFAKGGYLLEFESETDYSDYQGVVITLEETEDENPETHVLEGAF